MQILLALSDEQVQDIMLLRQLYHNKLALLSMERRELVNQMALLEQEEQHPAEHVVTGSDLSKCLKDNVDEKHQTHYRVARVLHRGVSHASPAAAAAAAAAAAGHNVLLAVAYHHLLCPVLIKVNG